MQRIASPQVLVLLLFSALAGGAWADSLRFEKLLTFASDKSVRIDCEFKSTEDLGPVALSAAITRDQTGQPLWQGSLGQATIRPGAAAEVSHNVSNLKPDLWEPTAPALYHVKVTAKKGNQVIAEKTVRFGFRSMEIRDGQFHLNGRPVFLRGIAINPPGRTIPPEVGESRVFAEAYVRYLKSQNVNIFRLSTDSSQVWFDVCDELGMMMYAGRYGSPPGGDEGKRGAPTDFARSIAAYKELFQGYVNHPSIVMYYLSNELPVSGERGAAYSALLTRAHAELKQWDPTRPYIGNAGYGEGREGDVCDVHRYWGWYYNSFLTYYNLRDRLVPTPLFGDPAKNQPLTFTECVGCFTGSSGEFNIVRSKQLGAQLGWTGHSAAQREDALKYQSFMVKQAAESFRRLRPLNPRLSGLMPFTILFYNWSGITSFDQMKPKPALEQMSVSYQPVLLSWETWTPQVYAGSKLHAFAHVINDAEEGRALANARLVFQVQALRGGGAWCRRTLPLPEIPYYGTWKQALDLDLPADLATGDYVLSGSVVAGTQILSTNWAELFVAGKDWKAARSPEPVRLYDPSGKTSAAFTKAGIRFQPWTDLATWPARTAAVVIGEAAWDKQLAAHKQELRQFVKSGGRVLCLRQEPEAFDRDWLPQEITFLTGSPNETHYPPRTRPFREQMNINPERPDHPVFRGLDRHRLALWSDYSGWDQTQPGFPRVYPVTAGFKLGKPEALASTAILADYDRGLEAIALCELFDGKGSVLLSGFDLVNRAGLDPAADRLLANLVAYAASAGPHPVYPLVEQPIQWGNYSSERGLVCGSLNGLVVNAEWVVPPTNPSATPLAPNTGAWNMMPGDQFVPRGRNPFGPYSYSTASSLRNLNPDSQTGSGAFWASIPSGRKTVVTKVKNPAAAAGELTVAIDGKTEARAATIAPGATVELRFPLPAGATNVSVRYTGTKTLVLLETAFE